MSVPRSKTPTRRHHQREGGRVVSICGFDPRSIRLCSPQNKIHTLERLPPLSATHCPRAIWLCFHRDGGTLVFVAGDGECSWENILMFYSSSMGEGNPAWISAPPRHSSWSYSTICYTCTFEQNSTVRQCQPYHIISYPSIQPNSANVKHSTLILDLPLALPGLAQLLAGDP